MDYKVYVLFASKKNFYTNKILGVYRNFNDAFDALKVLDRSPNSEDIDSHLEEFTIQ